MSDFYLLSFLDMNTVHVHAVSNLNPLILHLVYRSCSSLPTHSPLYSFAATLAFTVFPLPSSSDARIYPAR